MIHLTARLSGTRPIITGQQRGIAHAHHKARCDPPWAGRARGRHDPRADCPNAITPAHASLSPGTGRTSVTLPAGFAVGDGSNGPALSPVSCAHGTHFYVVIAADAAVKGPDGTIGQGHLVTSDEHTWHHYQGLRSSSMHVTAISCPTTKVCFVSGPGPQDQPRVAESSNGGSAGSALTRPAGAPRSAGGPTRSTASAPPRAGWQDGRKRGKPGGRGDDGPGIDLDDVLQPAEQPERRLPAERNLLHLGTGLRRGRRPRLSQLAG